MACATAVLAVLGLGLTMLAGDPAAAALEPTPTPVAVEAPSPSTSANAGPTAAATRIAPSTSPTTPPPSPSTSPSTAPSSRYGDLNGMPADAQVAHRLPLAVMIDNNARARPQAGFTRASIVYQAPNDYGTDRYMLVFQEQDSELVGPVRSTRPYFASWTTEYRAAYAHFGGDGTALKRVSEIDGDLIFDLDALRGSGRAYWRDDKRRAPFNAYTTTGRLWNEARRRGAPASMVEGLAQRPFADDLPIEVRPASGSITVPYRRETVSYKYDRDANSYRRSLAGKPHIDALDNSRVTARNVIVQFVKFTYGAGSRQGRVLMEHVGEGPAIVFRDGLAIEGTWQKKNESALTRFLDEAGEEISLVRGPIYIQVVPERARILYEVGELP